MILRAIFANQIRTAAASAEWSPPSSIEWMPAGRKEIRCLGPDEEGIECVSVATPEDAARLDAQLQSLIALSDKGQSSRPYIDFDHENGPAAAIPKRIYWDDGIRVEVDWTSAGADALKGRVYSYFSPSWLISDDGHPQALPEKGPIGSLVNTPAFQDIERLAAKNAATAANRKGTSMNGLIAKLVAAGLMSKPDGDMTEDQLVAALQAQMKAATDMADEAKVQCEQATASATEAKAKLVEISKAFASADVDEAVTAGRIDKDAADEWKKDYEANPIGARKRLASIKVAARGADLTALGKKTEPNKPELSGLQRAIAARRAELAAKKN